MRSAQLLTRLSGDVKGTTAVLFGITAVAILGTAAVGLDAARGFNVRSSLQSALDAAMLSAATRMYDSDPDLVGIARTYINQNWRDKLGAENIDVTVRQDAQGKLWGRAEVRVPITLGRVLGFDDMSIRVESEIVAGSQDIEAALVVDNTGSMSGAKLDALKRSARTLVESVFAGRNAELHAKIGIVPFAQYVNVGMANRNKPWMSVPLDSSTTTNQCWDHYELISSSNCRMVTATGYNDGVPYTYQYETCDYVYAPPERRCADITNNTTWYGCAGSRNYPLNVRDEGYATPIPGIMNVGCPSPITPLSNDKSELLDQIDALVATGNTYIPSGLVWGWRVLSKDEPFDEARDYGELVNGKPVRKIMVLMTDGANTLSATQPTHDGGDVAAANGLTTELCTNIKARGIELFTVAFEVIDNAIKDILRGCATTPAQFFDAADSDQLDAAFRNIARDMIAMHVAR